ncbi:hypothetical protein DM02DRAFT_616301 [Periconia macrospinosa]|uniref:Sin3-associated polypeptide Sap18 n=1 Tax=Periconia macrospinosa TaxID=97972 RepID=A0A2V1DHV6_9PLEO|nr:hypothetical protein DM02DRAFT_616301 [Periconia macrospinosa]
MAGHAPPPAKIDRQTTTPFLLRLFYKHNAFNRLDEFVPGTRLPPSLQIYTWQSCTLRELSTLLLTALPNLLEKPYPGTRIAFRLVYADLASAGRSGMGPRYISRELGSVVVGAGLPASSDEDEVMHEDGEADGENGDDAAKENGNSHTNGNGNRKSTPSTTINSTSEALSHLTGGEPDKTLQDARFVIGDYVCAAILPPLSDGSVQAAPPPPAPSGPSMRSDGYGPRGGNGYGGGGGRGGRGGGRFSFSDDRRGSGSGGVPHGEWRRGEAPPERERERDRGDYGGGSWRGGGGGGGYQGRGGGRGRGRW